MLGTRKLHIEVLSLRDVGNVSLIKDVRDV
jgi:hypothetical protein